MAAVVIARLLGPASYGIYSIALLVPATLFEIVGFGVNMGISRLTAYHISKLEAERARRITRNAIAFEVVLGAALAGLVYLGSGPISYALFHRPEAVPYLRESSLLVLGEAMLQSSISAFIGWNMVGTATLLSLSQSAMKFVLSTSLVVWGYGVNGAIAGHVASYLVAGVFALSVVAKRRLAGPTKSNHGVLEDIEYAVRYGSPLAAANLVSTLSSYFVIFLMALVGTNQVIGYYSAGANVTAIITRSSAGISLALLPTFAGLHGIGSDMKNALRLAVKYTAYLLTPIIAFIAFFPDLVIRVLYGASFVEAAPFLRLLAIGYLPMVVGMTVVPTYFNGIGRTRLTLYSTLSGSVLLYALAPVLGIFAGALDILYSVVVSNAAIAVVALALSSRYLFAKVDLTSSARLFVSAAVSYLLLSIVRIPLPPTAGSLLVNGALFLALYATIAPLIRSIDFVDVANLGGIVDSFGLISHVVRPLLSWERRMLELSHTLTGRKKT
ncbi:MAG: oligosaccharide flippase family protein [Nitrososphaerales archaeon]|nr:oligosaccharide flippase family protein [Nitrososphaerales archaeon]